ncbi:MAG: Maf family protein [Eubacteriales bacterium]|nr:Maf family protein [Eubacteriales bacterium]
MVKYGLSIILASGSPRRIGMLHDIGIQPEVLIPEVDETVHLTLTPQQTVMCLALKKALAAELQLKQRAQADRNVLLIAADTLVYAGKVMGKPMSERDAFEMLRFLRGRTHSVYSGVCLIGAELGIRRVFFCVTHVKFSNYSDEDIRRYIATGEPMDKAGAYAIQGGFGPYVESIVGPRDNVIGFPLGMIKEELNAIGIGFNDKGTGASETE